MSINPNDAVKPNHSYNGFISMQSPLYEWLGLTASLGFIDIPDYEYEAGEKQKLYAHDIRLNQLHLKLQTVIQVKI
jgi:hypothetical protein